MTIQFHTKVSKKGTIKVPRHFHADTEVEITIKHSIPNSEKNGLSADEFISKWKGFLKGHDVSNDDRINYISEKYK